MVLTYDPKETNLSSYAEFVRQSAPGTIILAVPHTDIDRVLRYLARAGIWASRKGKQIRKGELHPIIIGPSSLGLDRKLKQRNRDYLDGVRIASDVVMIEDWVQWPGVEEYIAQEKAYPPIAALRIAAALDRAATSEYELARLRARGGNNGAPTSDDLTPAPTGSEGDSDPSTSPTSPRQFLTQDTCPALANSKVMFYKLGETNHRRAFFCFPPRRPWPCVCRRSSTRDRR